MSIPWPPEGFAEPPGGFRNLIPRIRPAQPCRVYWGSHGCHLPRGHDPVTQPHACDCCDCASHPDAGDGVLCVALPPYYGPETRFYGEEAEALGLPLVDTP